MNHTVKHELLVRRLAGAGNRIAWAAADVEKLAEALGASAADAEPELLKHFAAAAPEAPALTATVERDAGANRRFTFTVSSPAVDLAGDSIDQNGWDLKAYASNPVVLWSHAAGLTPIGRAVKTWVDGKRLRSTVEFAPAEISAAAEQVRGLVATGFLSACSVGFKPLKFTMSRDPARPFGLDFQKQRLLEWSVCSIPANPEALIDPGQRVESRSAKSESGEGDVARRRREVAAIREAAAIRERLALGST